MGARVCVHGDLSARGLYGDYRPARAGQTGILAQTFARTSKKVYY